MKYKIIFIFVLIAFFMPLFAEDVFSATKIDSLEFERKYNVFDRIITDARKFYERDDLFISSNSDYDFQVTDFSIFSIKLSEPDQKYLILYERKRISNDIIESTKRRFCILISFEKNTNNIHEYSVFEIQNYYIPQILNSKK